MRGPLRGRGSHALYQGTTLVGPLRAERQLGFIDACKNNVRSSLFFQRNFKSALYQGTTSVVPQKSQMTRALAPADLFFRLDSASGPARQCNRPGDTTFAGTNRTFPLVRMMNP